ncbi:MAG: Crp/Fnr family transcriptional regulator, partial [Bacteroidota bacterium]
MKLLNKTLLTQFPTFDEQALRQEILDNGIVFSFESGALLMDYGRIISDIPLVIRGGLRILRADEATGKEVFLYYVQPGQTCAMSLSCCTRHKRSEIKAIAEDNTELIMIPVEYMEVWLKKYPSWKNFIFETYQQSFDKLIHNIETISFQKLDQRLLDYLQRKARINNSHTFQITHQEIANELNS